MDRVQLVLLGLPILLFCSDVVTLFASLPPAAPQPDHQSRPGPGTFQPGDPSAADASAQAEQQADGPGSGTTVELKFCASCSYSRFGYPTLMLAFCSNFQVFSKLSEQRFPSELELQQLIGNRIPDSQEPIGNRIPDSQELIGNKIPDSQVRENLEKDLVLDNDGNDDDAEL
ncbi:hypothetical protein BAE44_0025577 [Dichanthelium oligosanthes]|uniref:SelT-like protein n=1 Tax=Dichanthelium oligosanthes TaxID=888268 RepID=A0A1E5UKU1_9POAL|nr:hypothetical protein BAE44_0025577 [Dichanthelium oligosanthes]